MLVPLLVFSIATISAYLVRFKNFKNGLIFSFFIIFIFLAFRYDYGNDYMPYLEMFNDINKSKYLDFANDEFHAEIGWVLLCRLCEPIGFFGMVILLAAFSTTVYYRFIVRYVSKNNYYFAIFIYLFDASFFLTQSSMMRQNVAMCFFILSVPALLNRNILQYVILVGIACCFHTSALFLLPLYFFSCFRFRITNKLAFVFFIFFVSLYFLTSSIKPLLGAFIEAYFKRYEVYLYDKSLELGTGLGLIYMSLMLLILLLYEKFQNEKFQLLFKLLIFGFVFNPLGFVFPLIGRVGMYLTVLSIIVYPQLYDTILNPVYKKCLLFTIFLISLYGFWSFFHSDIWKDSFETYSTIFSLNYWL